MMETDSLTFGPKARITPLVVILLIHASVVSVLVVYWLTTWIAPFKWLGWDGVLFQGIIGIAGWMAPWAFIRGRALLAVSCVALTAAAPWGFLYPGIIWSLLLATITAYIGLRIRTRGASGTARTEDALA